MIARIRHQLSLPGLGPMLIKAVTGSAGLRLVGMFFGFLVGVQLARGLGASGYGVYGTVMALVTVLMIPTEFGVPILVMREVAASKAKDGRGAAAAIVQWANRRVVLASMIVAAFIGLLLHFRLVPFDDGMRATLAFGLLWIPLVAVGNIYAAALRGSHMIVRGQVGELFIRPALTSALIFFVSLGAFSSLTPAFAMLLNVVTAGAALGYSATVLMRSSSYIHGTTPVTGLNIGAAFPVGMSEGMRILAGQVGILMLGFTVPQDEVGIYRVAFGIYIVTTMPSALVNATCSPMLSSLYTQGRKDSLVRLNLWIALFLIASSLACLVLGMLFASPMIALVFGEEYRAAIKVLIVFLAGELVASLFGHPVLALNMMREQRAVMKWSSVALVVNVIATWWLIKVIGYLGAAFGSVLGQVAWRAGCAVYAKRKLNVDTSPIILLLIQRAMRRR